MNKTLIIILVLFIFNGCSTKKSNKSETTSMQKVEIQTPSIMCDICVNTIKKALYKSDGIKSVEVDLKKKITTVEFSNELIDVTTIEKLISDVGYDANTVQRDPDAYNQLPECCKDGK